MSLNEEMLEWEVKPILKVIYPSSLVSTETTNFLIYGLERASGEIVRNYEYINSVEQHLQGYKKMPSDLRVTIVEKEQGEAFEKLRRIGKAGELFDVVMSLVRDQDANVEGGHDYATAEWMEGFEAWKGCIITRESQTIEIGDIPLREFECMSLRHSIKPVTASDTDYNTKEVEEGSGIPPTLSDLLS